MSDYKDWNTALWNYFFPGGEEDAILYLDAAILRSIAIDAGFEYSEPAEDDFLKKVLINDGETIRNFLCNYISWTGQGLPRVEGWTELVGALKETDARIDDAPPYFAVLCAIMYLASSEGPNHTMIRDRAKQYLGEGYRGRVGELVDELMQKLHRDRKSFNPDRMVCGNQRQMSRIKYHLVLKSDVRKDFIDFLEVGNLQWDECSYTDYANNILLPALYRAGKRQLIEIVKKTEYIPYVKNILLSDLDWGKSPNESVCGNARPIKDVKWKYEMELDYDGNPCFYISIDYSIPFGVRLEDSRFIKTDEKQEYIASGITFEELEPSVIEQDGFEYHFFNLSQDEKGKWNKEIFFQQVGERYYHQVAAPIEGKKHVMFIREGVRGIDNLTNGLTESQIQLGGYCLYTIDSFSNSNPNRNRRQNNMNIVNERFELEGLGTWFCIHLDDGQHAYWYPDLVNVSDNEIKTAIHAPNGKTYFRLPRNHDEFISGNFMVKDEQGGVLVSEQIKGNFLWNGHQAKYGINKWGEAIEGGSIPRREAGTNAHHLLRDCNDALFSQDSNMVIQILYDIADENGCVSRSKLKAALDFVLKFHAIIPTQKNRTSLIYALRRLGYIVASYDGREFVNQLVTPYIERTNYSFMAGSTNNAYLIKGVYPEESLQKILSLDGVEVKYKRPYSNNLLESYPEYICLPDFVFITTNRTDQGEQVCEGWNVVEHPIAYDYLAAIASMDSFEEHFGILTNGDVFNAGQGLDVPCMVKVNDKEQLCVRGLRGNYILRWSYSGEDNIYRVIPKQLSRVYCQNKHNKPVAILKTSRADRTTIVDPNSITILEQMGTPELFDIALCDLNLGMPENGICFVVDNKSSDLPYKENRPYLYGDTYNTANSVNSEEVRLGLERISDRKINNYFESSSVFLSPREMGFSMKMAVPSEGKICMALYQNDELVAFSIGSRKVYACVSGGGYKEVLNDETVNAKFSAVINHCDVEYGDKFAGTIPNFDNTISVKIIKKHQ